MRVVTAVVGAALFVSACSAGERTWELARVEGEGALLSVWGSGPDDVWAAGGQVGRGLVLHNDGSGWVEVDTGAGELLWWIYGFERDDIYAVGERGLIMHYDGVRWQVVESGTDRTLYGVWGASADDVWIVGGDPSGSAGSAVILRGHGRSFHRVEDVPAELLPSSLFKIYGFERSDVVAVGSGGTVIRFDGETWSRDSVPTSKAIFSLWGRAEDDVYAVGGYGAGDVLHFDGDAWHKAHDTSFGSGLSGVFTAPHDPMIAVGPDSYVLEMDRGGAVAEPELPAMAPRPSLHGVWGDGAGSVYVVGGDLFAYPKPMSGVILERR